MNDRHVHCSQCGDQIPILEQDNLPLGTLRSKVQQITRNPETGASANVWVHAYAHDSCIPGNPLVIQE